MTIGVAGMGRMGAAIAGRLLAAGESVAVWNRTAARTASLAAAGARVAKTPSELAGSCQTIISMLADASAVEATYGGADGLLHDPAGGRVFIDMSTLRPVAVRRLADQVAAAGGRFVECPVGGTVGPARDGKLFGFIGGDLADVALAMPVLARLCRRTEHVGPAGAGASVKLAVNLPMHVYWLALREALALCRPLGLAPSRLIDILADSSGAPASLRARQASIVAALEGADPASVDFDVDSIRKDLREMIEEARSLSAGLPLAEIALKFFDDGARRGLGNQGAAALLRIHDNDLPDR